MRRILKLFSALLALCIGMGPMTVFAERGSEDSHSVVSGSEVKVEANSARSAAQQNYSVNHGPYLQGLCYDGVIVVFTTSHKGFSKVEIRKRGQSEVRVCDSRKDGLIMANNTHNVIRIDGLEPATDYEYRIVSTKVEDFQPYKVTFGESISTPWYEFRTFDPKAREFNFVVLNDIHDDARKCDKLLSMQPMDKANMVFYVGDIMSYFSSPDQPYTSFIDVSVNRFAKHKPFAVVRGNHETRGYLARTYDQFIHNTRDGKYYGFYTFGSTAVVMLDCGEDKPDTHPVYAGFVAFDEYRLEQIEWLKGVLKSKEFRRAKNRIVLLHIPPAVEAMKQQDEKAVKDMLEWHGNVHWGQILLPLLNKADIDLMISAHQHSFHYFAPQKGVIEFPLVINDNHSAMYVSSNDDGISVKVTNQSGKELMNRKF
ncbi:MAG: metallophosphoesterase family protein [Alistipes sp.]|nr:metallophosphoesterase family protein [Alistipes sp.]